MEIRRRDLRAMYQSKLETPFGSIAVRHRSSLTFMGHEAFGRSLSPCSGCLPNRPLTPMRIACHSDCGHCAVTSSNTDVGGNSVG